MGNSQKEAFAKGENLSEEELKSYEKDYNKQSFIDKILKLAGKGAKKVIYIALCLFYSLDYTSVLNKVLIIGALGYLISPIDLIPDEIPVIGLMDDYGVLVAALGKVRADLDDESLNLVRNKALEKMRDLFDEVNEEEFKDIL